ncbi:MAG: hypothetical protein WBJ33_00545 [Candidatus Nanopelagicales bacterium]|jgi:type III secretory pathway component EscU
MSSHEPGQNTPEESIWSEGSVPAPESAQPAGQVPNGAVITSQPTSSNSIVALVLSIVSWVVCPVIFAIVALVFASKADKEIAASGGRIGGGSLVLASKILSWINIGVFTALFVLGILVLLFLTIAGVSSN